MNISDFWGSFDQGIRDFKGASITDAFFDGVEFNDIDFSCVNFQGAKIRKSVFRNCLLNEVSFRHADFNRCKFLDCQMKKTDFTGFISVELEFEACNLKEADFTGGEMGDVYFVGSNISKSQWKNAWWTGGLNKCNLLGSNMHMLSASSVEIIDTVYPNGVKGDHSWCNLTIRGEPPNPYTDKIIHSPEAVVFKSAMGIDYSQLNDLLRECNWKEAEDKTEEILWELMSKPTGYLTEELIAQVPCVDLYTIDLLWLENSWGRFGFSTQHQIWLGICGGYTGNTKKYARFKKLVKWSSSDSIAVFDKEIKDERSVKLAPVGYYPVISRWTNCTFGWEEMIGCFYHHLSKCQQMTKEENDASSNKQPIDNQSIVREDMEILSDILFEKIDYRLNQLEGRLDELIKILSKKK
jgi:GUN4-like/Pentapeptide repeats (9 copies)